MQTDNNEGKWKTMNMEAWIEWILCSLQITIILTVIVVCFGANVVELILEVIPEWVTNGLSIAAGMLPVVGIGMLMRYMPVKKFLPFILVRICSVRIFGSTGSWNCDYRICGSILVFYNRD